jgi:hypothetical protein
MLSVIYAECRYATYRDAMACKELVLEEKGKVCTFLVQIVIILHGCLLCTSSHNMLYLTLIITAN